MKNFLSWIHLGGGDRGVIHSFDKAYQIFSQQKDSNGFFDGFFLKIKGFLQNVYEIFLGVKCTSGRGTKIMDKIV